MPGKYKLRHLTIRLKRPSFWQWMQGSALVEVTGDFGSGLEQKIQSVYMTPKDNLDINVHQEPEERLIIR